MVSLSSLKLEIDAHGQVLTDLRRRVVALEGASASTREEWEHEKRLVLEAVKAHVGTVVAHELGSARRAIELEMAKVHAVLLRLERTGNLGTLEKLVALLADEAKVGLLRDAIDEQIYARVSQAKRDASNADITASLDLEEKRRKPFRERITATQVVVATIVAIITGLGGLAALSHLVH